MSDTNNETEAKWKKLRDGVATVVPTGSTMTVDGQSYTQAQLLAKIDAVLSILAAAETAKAQFQAAVATARAGRPANSQWLADFTVVLKQTLGNRSPQLGAFGIALKTSPTPQTSEQKTLAAAKRAATRKVRNVLSKKQRAAIPAVTGLALQVVKVGDAVSAASIPQVVSAVAPATTVVAATTPTQTKS